MASHDLLLQPLEILVSGPLYPKLSMCFEGAWLTLLVHLITASRLFLACKGQVNPLIDEWLYHKCKFWSQRILTPSKPLSHYYGLEWEEIKCDAEDTQDMTQLDLKHDECRRARKSQGYKAGELQPQYLIQLKYKKCGHGRTPQTCKP